MPSTGRSVSSKAIVFSLLRYNQKELGLYGLIEVNVWLLLFGPFVYVGKLAFSRERFLFYNFKGQGRLAFLAEIYLFALLLLLSFFLVKKREDY